MKSSVPETRTSRNYKDWMPVKESIQEQGILRKFKEWEIWWCSIGENVGITANH